MAFIAQNLSLLVDPIGGVGMRWFSYKTDDAQALLLAADYVPRASDYGLRVDDLVFVSQITSGAEPYILLVSEIDALDSATFTFGDSLELGPYATLAEALAGVSETTTMNPLRTMQVIRASAGYDTLADFEAATIDDDVDTVSVKGFYAPGDCEEPIILERTTDVPGANLLRMSEYYEGPGIRWTKTRVTVTSDALRVGSGDTAKTASKIVPSTDNDTHLMQQAIEITTGLPYVMSVKYKGSGNPYFRLQFGSNGFPANALATFNMSNGTVVAGAGITSADCGVVNLGNSEWICWMRCTSTATANVNFNISFMSPDGTTATFAGNGTNGAYFWDLQVDQAAALTDYVKTLVNAHPIRLSRGYVTNGGDLWKYSPDQLLTSRKFGAKCTGADTTIAYTGDDDTFAIAQGIMFAARHRKTFWPSAGDHYIAQQNVNGAGYINIDFDYVSVKGFGRHSSRIFLDEDLTYYTEANGYLAALFDTGIINDPPYDRGLRKSSHWEDFAIHGRWSHGAGRFGVAFIRVVGCADFQTENMGFYDGRSSAVRNAYNNSFKVLRCHLERCSGGFRSSETNRYVAIGNNVRWTGDDVFDCHSANGVVSVYGPIRLQTIIIGNHVTDTESGVISLGGRATTVIGNTFNRVAGAAITVGYQSMAEGTGTSLGNIITGNTIIDAIGRYDAGVWNAYDGGAIVLAGTPRSSASSVNVTTPGAYDSTAGAFVLPYSNEDRSVAPLSGAMHIGPTGTYSSPGGMSNQCSNNVIKRTLPNVTNWSDWGVGDYFNSHEGWLDPAVTDDTFREQGIALWGDMEDVSVIGNIITGLEIGIYFLVPGNVTKDRKTSFRSILIAGNRIKDCRRGIDKDNTGSNLALGSMDSWSVIFDGNEIDVDPYHRASIRNTDGTWDTDTTLDYRAFNLYNMSGFILRNNTVWNCYDIVTFNSDIHLQGTCVGNTLRCQPVTDGVSNTNKGIANVRAAGEAWRYQVWDSTPGNSTFGRMLNSCATRAAAMPATGTFVRGHFVENSAHSVTAAGFRLTGWLRLITGSGHVLDTDWAEIYVDTKTLLAGSATFDPASLADGAGETTTVTVTGAAVGDYVVALSFSNALQGILLTGWVGGANSVSVRFQNESGGVLDLASGTLRALVRPA